MDHKVIGNSSKELLYSEYTRNTVIGHVFETLEKKPNKISFENKKTFKNEKKCEALVKVQKLLNLVEKEGKESNSSEKLTQKSDDDSSENKREIEVVMQVNENAPESDVNAWFMLTVQKEQESKCSGDNAELQKNSSADGILDFSDSSDTSDDESQQNFPVITNGFSLNVTNSSDGKGEVNPSHSSKIKSTSNFANDDSTDTSDDEVQQNFPIISNGFLLNGTDSSSSVSDEELNSSTFANDDSTNSSDVKTNHFLSVTTPNENLECEDSGTLQISLPQQNNKRIFEITDDSSEYSNDDLVKDSTSSANGVKLSLEKKMKSNFALNGSSSYSLHDCEKNIKYTNGQNCIEDNSNSSNCMADDFALEREKVTMLKDISSKALDSEYLPKKSSSLKRKLSVDGKIPETCNIKNTKKSLCLSAE